MRFDIVTLIEKFHWHQKLMSHEKLLLLALFLSATNTFLSKIILCHLQLVKFIMSLFHMNVCTFFILQNAQIQLYLSVNIKSKYINLNFRTLKKLSCDKRLIKEQILLWKVTTINRQPVFSREQITLKGLDGRGHFQTI